MNDDKSMPESARNRSTFVLVEEQMTSMANRIVIRLGALMVVLTGLLGVMLGLMRR
jgi:hypothetical protein